MFLSILLLWILYYTHWLPGLEKDVQCSRWIINGFLLTMMVSSWLPPIHLDSRVAIHVGMIMIGIASFYCWIQINEKAIFLVLLLSSCSLVFMIHRIFYFPVDWDSLSFRIFMIVFFVFGAFLLFQQFIERAAYLWSGCLVTHCFLLSAYFEMFNPAVLGEQTFLDFCGFAMLVLVLIQHGMGPFWIRLRNR